MGRFSSNPDLFWYFSGQSQTVFGFYSSLMIAAEKLLPLGALAGAKTKRFAAGRKDWLPRLQAIISSEDRNIWFHCASLGEYEQAVPVIRECRRIFPQHRILLTFFSPSGMEVKKNSSLADVTSYLPLDTKKNAGKFLDLVKPEVAIFINMSSGPTSLGNYKDGKYQPCWFPESFGRTSYSSSRMDDGFLRPFRPLITFLSRINSQKNS